jgi:hypothetical protein
LPNAASVRHFELSKIVQLVRRRMKKKKKKNENEKDAKRSMIFLRSFVLREMP